MSRYVGAIDQGTTSSRFIVFDREGSVIALAQAEHAQIYPAPGHVEHRHEGLGEGQERRGAAVRRAQLQEIAATVVRHGHDRPDECPGLVHRRGADQVGRIDLVVVLGGRQAVAGDEQGDAVERLGGAAAGDALHPGDQHVG